MKRTIKSQNDRANTALDEIKSTLWEIIDFCRGQHPAHLHELNYLNDTHDLIISGDDRILLLKQLMASDADHLTAAVAGALKAIDAQIKPDSDLRQLIRLIALASIRTGEMRGRYESYDTAREIHLKNTEVDNIQTADRRRPKAKWEYTCWRFARKFCDFRDGRISKRDLHNFLLRLQEDKLDDGDPTWDRDFVRQQLHGKGIPIDPKAADAVFDRWVRRRHIVLANDEWRPSSKDPLKNQRITRGQV